MNWFLLWFDGKTGRVRSGWRAAIYLVALNVAGFLVMFGISMPLAQAFHLDITKFFKTPVGSSTMDLTSILITYLTMIAANVAAAVVLLRNLDHLPSHTLGLGLDGRRLLALVGGFAGTLVLIFLLVALCVGTGFAHVQVNVVTPIMLQHLSLALGALLIVAMATELMYRGYLFQTLLRGIGMPITLLLMACFIAIPPDKNATPLVITNLALEGVLFGLLYLRAGHLWLSIGASAGWKLGLLLCHLRISGTEIPIATPLLATLTGHPLLTGGDYGPEGGAVVSALLLLLIAAVAYAPIGLPLTSRWWEWPDLTTPAARLPAWDFTVDNRAYQWKLLPREPGES